MCENGYCRNASAQESPKGSVRGTALVAMHIGSCCILTKRFACVPCRGWAKATSVLGNSLDADAPLQLNVQMGSDSRDNTASRSEVSAVIEEYHIPLDSYPEPQVWVFC